jgi:hypothetical protein
MEISKFNEKLNKLDGKIYTIEEEVTLTNGEYEGTLAHDNINKKSLNIYTGSQLTGEKIANYFLSTPSETPWKNTIKIFCSESPVYISYETIGDQVEAEDINNLQDSIVAAQQEINSYEESNNTRVSNAEIRITNVENDKVDKDKVYTKEEVLQKISDLINGSPQTLDTLNEIATALGNDPNFSTTIINLLGNKVDKITGKSLISDLEWGSIKNEIDNARGTFQNIDERLQSIDGGNSSDMLYPTTNIGNNYSITIPDLATLTDGYPLTVKFNAISTGAITVNPNGLGNISVVDYFGNPVTNVRTNLIVNLRYESTSNSFTLLGKGGGGDATAAQLLLGKKAMVDSGPIVGTLDLTNLVTANIKSGITINGVDGKASVVETSDATAIAADILSSKSAYVNGIKVTGTISSKAAATYTPGTTNQTIAAGQYLSGAQTIAGDTDLISANIKAGANIFGVAGNSNVVDTTAGTAVATDILSGKIAFVDGAQVTGTIPSKVAATITPGTVDQSIAANQFLAGIQTILGDADLIAANIISGKTIFNVAGTASITSLGGLVGAHGTTNTGVVTGLNFQPNFVLLTCTTDSGADHIDVESPSVSVAVKPMLYGTTGGQLYSYSSSQYAGYSDIVFNATGFSFSAYASKTNYWIAIKF